MNTATQRTEPAPAAAAVRQGVDQQAHQYLTFMLGTEVFAIGILAIKEIIEFDNLTAVPMMPGCIRGVINLRGAVVPVMDVSARFNRGATTVTRRTCIVIVEVEAAGEHRDVGIIVDAVNEVLEIPAAAIEPPPSFGSSIRAGFIRGMGKVGGKFVVILDTDSLLCGDDLDLMDVAGPAAGAHAAMAN